MPIGDVCITDVTVAGRDATIQDAALLMRRNHTGTIVVVDRDAGFEKPVGIVTDRDIVVSAIAMKLDPAIFTLGDMAWPELVTAQQDEGVLECIQRMARHGIRRMPVLNNAGNLAGIVAVDDLIGLLADELGEVANVISTEQAREMAIKQ